MRTTTRSTRQEGARAHLLAGTPSRHDAAAAAVTKGCATFWVEGDPGEAPRRVAVPVAMLGHPRMLELLGEAREEYGFEHEGAVVLPCGVERFVRAVEASAPAGHEHGRHGHHHFRLPHIDIACCFWPSHVVV
ncbi:unnamed protein product [Urochloa humidicola]